MKRSQFNTAPRPEPKDMCLRIDGEYEYQISQRDCNSIPRILFYVIHLLEQPWITTKKIKAFVRIAAEINHLDVSLSKRLPGRKVQIGEDETNGE